MVTSILARFLDFVIYYSYLLVRRVRSLAPKGLSTPTDYKGHYSVARYTYNGKEYIFMQKICDPLPGYIYVSVCGQLDDGSFCSDNITEFFKMVAGPNADMHGQDILLRDIVELYDSKYEKCDKIEITVFKDDGECMTFVA